MEGEKTEIASLVQEVTVDVDAVGLAEVGRDEGADGGEECGLRSLFRERAILGAAKVGVIEVGKLRG